MENIQKSKNFSKIKKIITINLIFIFLLFFIVEIGFYFNSLVLQYKSFKSNNVPMNLFDISYHIRMLPYKKFYKNVIKKYQIRKPDGLNYEKEPIVLFGCSYTYGFKLNDDETFSYKLSNYTKRPVYNRGICSTSIQHAIFQAQDTDFYKEVPEPEYIIYTWNSPLLTFRLYRHIFNLWDKALIPIFIERNNELIPYKPHFYDGFYTYKVYNIFKYKENNKNLTEQDRKFILLHFNKLKNEIEKHWKNTKFVILFYTHDNDCENFDNELKKELINQGFIVTDTQDLTGQLMNVDYSISNVDSHPNKKAWNLIVPKLVEYLNL